MHAHTHAHTNRPFGTPKHPRLLGHGVCLTLQVSAHSLDTGIRGGYYNVCINLKQVADEDYVGAVTAEVEEMARASTASLEAILDIAKKREK